jgi:hypothetical protein
MGVSRSQATAFVRCGLSLNPCGILGLIRNKKRPLGRVTQRPIGGGEGTDVPCLSAWAGLCLHPRGMRGVLASDDAPSARSSDDQRVSESLQGQRS